MTSINTHAPVDNRSPIETRIDMLQVTISEVDEELAALIHRLGPCLGPAQDDGDLAEPKPAEASELSRALDRETDRLRNIRRHINVLRQRVEL